MKKPARRDPPRWVMGHGKPSSNVIYIYIYINKIRNKYICGCLILWSHRISSRQPCLYCDVGLALCNSSFGLLWKTGRKLGKTHKDGRRDDRRLTQSWQSWIRTSLGSNFQATHVGQVSSMFSVETSLNLGKTWTASILGAYEFKVEYYQLVTVILYLIGIMARWLHG